ncbi:hypothetical protein GOP47_0024572 [Adiantum capillus-veneris]|uniref:Uncharacterized protein n=1 Tax=Adiantum capillus-veneris TaxID=13818 RepID=A0A9D4U2I5_ADICA|nr:hypothetical protein GOP47_0024572 [Adiantum capillus-veneris]
MMTKKACFSKHSHSLLSDPLLLLCPPEGVSGTSPRQEKLPRVANEGTYSTEAEVSHTAEGAFFCGEVFKSSS